MRSILFIAIMLFNLFSCRVKQKEESKSRDFVTFNEGVILNLQSISEQEIGNYEKASELNKKSIEKFKETLKIDSSHALARSALAHGLYIDKQFQEAINWFEQAIKTNGEIAANYRELGLSKINLGRIQEGKADLDWAFSIDTSIEIREINIQDLTDIGDLAFSYGEGLFSKVNKKEEVIINISLLGF